MSWRRSSGLNYYGRCEGMDGPLESRRGDPAPAPRIRVPGADSRKMSEYLKATMYWLQGQPDRDIAVPHPDEEHPPPPARSVEYCKQNGNKVELLMKDNHTLKATRAMRPAGRDCS